MSYRLGQTAIVCAIAAFTGFSAHGQEYMIDPVHSSVVFKVGHLGVSNAWGRFNDIKGTFEIDPENLEESRIALAIDAASIDTNNDQRDEHLRSADFFDTEKYPVIAFESSDIEQLEEGVYEATGALTLHGVTKPMEIRIYKVGEGKGRRGETRAGYDANFFINRSEFGMQNMIGPVGDEIRIFVSVEGVAQDSEDAEEGEE